MYGKLSLQPNPDGTYDLIITYGGSGDAEFGLDFLASGRVQESYDSVAEYLRKFGQGLRVRRAKIVSGAVVLAVLPINMLLPAQAASDRFSMAYLYHGTEKQQIEQVRQAQDALDTVSPSYFDIASDGSLIFNKPAAGTVDAYHAMGMTMVPFLSNHWNREAGIAMLDNMDEVTDEIAALVEEYGFDGINADIENLTPDERDDYVQFLSLLREKMPAEKEISVAVAANPRGWTTGWQGSYDYAGLADYADYLMLMTYDEHFQGGEAGPVASASFVERSIQYALEQVSEDQVVVGLPLFGRIWGGGGHFEGHGVPLSVVEDIVETYGAEVTFDEEAQSPKAVFTVEPGDERILINGRALVTGEYELWYEDDASMRAKLALIDDYGVKGGGFWALGQQTDSVWNTYQSWITGEDLTDGDREDAGDPGDGDTGSNGSTPAPGGSAGGGSGSSGAWRPGGGSGSSGGGGGGGRGGASSSGLLITPTTGSVQAVQNTPGAVLANTGMVNTADAVLRKSADLGASPVTTMQQGSVITILEKNGDWYKVQLSGGTVGYLPVLHITQHRVAVVTPNAGTQVFAEAAPGSILIGTLTSGTPVTILEERQDGWCKIRMADKRVGYIQSKSAARTTRGRAIDIRTTTTALKLRDTASVGANSLGTIPAGEQVLVLDSETSGYTRISYGGTIAYITDGYLQKKA